MNIDTKGLLSGGLAAAKPSPIQNSHIKVFLATYWRKRSTDQKRRKRNIWMFSLVSSHSFKSLVLHCCFQRGQALTGWWFGGCKTRGKVIPLSTGCWRESRCPGGQLAATVTSTTLPPRYAVLDLILSAPQLKRSISSTRPITTALV